MQKQRLIPVVLLIALMFFSSGLMYHLPGGGKVPPMNDVNCSSDNIRLLSENEQNLHTEEPNVTVLSNEPVLTGSDVGLSERSSNPYSGEGGNLMHSFTKKEDVFSGNKFTKTELEDESAGETTGIEVT